MYIIRKYCPIITTHNLQLHLHNIIQIFLCIVCMKPMKMPNQIGIVNILFSDVPQSHKIPFWWGEQMSFQLPFKGKKLKENKVSEASINPRQLSSSTTRTVFLLYFTISINNTKESHTQSRCSPRESIVLVQTNYCTRQN